MFKKYLQFAILFLPFTIFTKEIGMYRVGGIDLDILSYPFFILSFVIFFVIRKLSLSKEEIYIFSLILIIGLLNTVLFDLPSFNFFKQFIPITIFYFVTKTIINYGNPVTIFKRYVDFAIIAAFLGVIQILLKIAGIKFLTAYSGLFIDSLALEPSHYVVMIMPAFIYFYEKKIFKWKFFLLLLTLILTFKLTALLAFATYYIIRNLKRLKKIIFVVPVVIVAVIYIINNSPEFEKRFNSALIFAKNQDISQVDNLTTFSFVSNLEVAKDNFIRTYGIGIGLGGHETTYLRNFNVDIYSDRWYGTNMKSAHSLLIRVISEIGIIGIFILFMLFYKTFKLKQLDYQIIAWASLSHFIVKIYKTGSYFDYGTIFFLVMIITMIRFDNNATVDTRHFEK